MLVDTNITVAYKCSSCGSFEFVSRSVFSLLSLKERSFACHCGKSLITLLYDGRGNIAVRVPCISCGNEHIFVAGVRGLLHNEISVFSCPATGMQQCFIGRDEAVRSKVDSIEKELDEIIDMFGYDNYFKNTQVMFDSLNRIHDLAEQGGLFCECGNSDIELILLPDKIHLKCKQCSGYRIVNAASNGDLKDILLKQHILLQREMSGLDSKSKGF